MEVATDDGPQIPSGEDRPRTMRAVVVSEPGGVDRLVVAASEPDSGVLAYEFYRDENGVCVHRDSYVDEATALEFLKNKAAIEEWLQIADPIDTLLLGDVSDEARAVPPRTTTAYSTVQGFTR